MKSTCRHVKNKQLTLHFSNDIMYMGVHVHDIKKTEQAARFLKLGLSKAAEFFRMADQSLQFAKVLSMGYNGT